MNAQKSSFESPELGSIRIIWPRDPIEARRCEKALTAEDVAVGSRVDMILKVPIAAAIDHDASRA
jgi:hypothetical protein